MRWVIMLVVIAAIAAYFTRPDRDTMSAAANKFIGGNLLDQAAGAISGRSFDDYYVVTKYTVADSVTCWGAFKQVQCSHNKPSESK